MYKYVYIGLFVILGILLQFLIHAVVEMGVITLLLDNFERYNLGLSWTQWYVVHHVFAVLLLVAGVYFGYTQGKHWWHVVYE